MDHLFNVTLSSYSSSEKMMTPLPYYAMLQVALSRPRLGAGAATASRKLVYIFIIPVENLVLEK